MKNYLLIGLSLIIITANTIHSKTRRRKPTTNNAIETNIVLATGIKKSDQVKRKRHGRHTKVPHSKTRHNTLSSMNLSELRESKNAFLKADNKETAIKYLEKMIPVCKDLAEKAKIMLELADCYYDTEKSIQAYTMYREFVNLYPGCKDVEYASYKAIACKFDKINDPQRDQSTTKETLELTKEFLEHKDVFTTYADAVEKIDSQCNHRLFENEQEIFNFYVGNGRFLAASKRLESIKKEFIEILPNVEPEVLLLEIKLAETQNNEEIITQKQNELITKFPDFVMTTAHNISKKKSVTDRF